MAYLIAQPFPCGEQYGKVWVIPILPTIKGSVLIIKTVVNLVAMFPTFSGETTQGQPKITHEVYTIINELHHVRGEFCRSIVKTIQLIKSHSMKFVINDLLS